MQVAVLLVPLAFFSTFTLASRTLPINSKNFPSACEAVKRQLGSLCQRESDAKPQEVTALIAVLKALREFVSLSLESPESQRLTSALHYLKNIKTIVHDTDSLFDLCQERKQKLKDMLESSYENLIDDSQGLRLKLKFLHVIAYFSAVLTREVDNLRGLQIAEDFDARLLGPLVRKNTPYPAETLFEVYDGIFEIFSDARYPTERSQLTEALRGKLGENLNSAEEIKTVLRTLQAASERPKNANNDPGVMQTSVPFTPNSRSSLSTVATVSSDRENVNTDKDTPTDGPERPRGLYAGILIASIILIIGVAGYVVIKVGKIN